MSLIVTSLTAVAGSLLILAQTFSIIAMRRGENIVHGDGGNKTMMKRIRGHANAVEQVPLFLIVLGLAEYSGALSTVLLSIISVIFILGRCAHAIYFLDIGLNFRFRQYGMAATLTAQVFAILSLCFGLLN